MAREMALLLSWKASFLKKHHQSIKHSQHTRAFAQLRDGSSAMFALTFALPVPLFRHPAPPHFPSKWCDAVYSPWAANINPCRKVFVWFGREHVIHIGPRVLVFYWAFLTCSPWQALVLHAALLHAAWMGQNCGVFPLDSKNGAPTPYFVR